MIKPKIVVAALYQFAHFPQFEAVREPLRQFCVDRSIKGTLILAAEGINGTVSGSRDSIDELLAFLKEDPIFEDCFRALEHKESYSNESPFYRTKIKLKREIVTLGVPGIDPNQCVGTYIPPEEWNNLIEQPDVLLIDTRNDYEFAIGTFQGALNPDTKSFREFPEFVDQHCDPVQHKRVAMFCTGGIRCEKASAYLLMRGFSEVFHLKGGILSYLEKVPAEQSLWKGECFVFDNRVAVTHGLEVGRYELCHGCRFPLDESDKQSPHYKPGISCPKCASTLSEGQVRRFAERQKQIELAKARNEAHIGFNPRCAKKVVTG